MVSPLLFEVFFVVRKFIDFRFCQESSNTSEGGYILYGGAEKMAGKEKRVSVTLVCTECKQRNYDTAKNKQNTPDRLEMNKHCKFCRKHTLHKESK